MPGLETRREGAQRPLARPPGRPSGCVREATTGRPIRTSGSTRCATPRSSARSARRSTTMPPPRRLARRLDALDAEFRRGLARCERRQIVTSHAAFGYLAARYGLEQVPLEGLSPEAEPSPRDLAHLVDLVRASGCDDRVLRDARLAQARADGRAGGRRRNGGARSARGSHRRRDRRGRRLLLRDAGESRRPPEGARMPGRDPAPPVVELDGVSFGYRAGVRVLEDVSLAVGAGEFVAIAGPNGGGKTTLLRLVLGLERPASGNGRASPLRASAISRSARGCSARRPSPCARSSPPAASRRPASGGRCGAPTAKP